LTLMQWRVAFSVVMVIVWAWIASKLLPRASLYPRWHRTPFRRSIRFGSWDTLSSLGGLLASHTDKFLLGTYLSMTAVGLYNVASTIQGTIYVGVYTIAGVLFPAISDLQGSGQDKRAVILTLRSGWLLSVASVLLMAPLAIFAHDLLRLYVGVDIAASAAPLLRILAIAGISSSGSVSLNQYIYGIGKTQWLMVMSFASGIVILIGGLILIPAFGLIGAGWMQIFAIVLSRPLIHVFLWRSLLRGQVSAKLFFSYLYGPSVIGVFGTLLILLSRLQLHWLPGWWGLIIGSVSCSLMLLAGICIADMILPAGKDRRAAVGKLLALGQSQTSSHWSAFMLKLARMRTISPDDDRL
jgi:O-antigen/teichoic acid export membrane protein